MNKKFIAERITQLRMKKNLSEYQMSLDLGRNKGYIQSITSGKALPSMAQFLEICEYLVIMPAEFFEQSEMSMLIRKAAHMMQALKDEDILLMISVMQRLMDKGTPGTSQQNRS